MSKDHNVTLISTSLYGSKHIRTDPNYRSRIKCLPLKMCIKLSLLILCCDINTTFLAENDSILCFLLSQEYWFSPNYLGCMDTSIKVLYPCCIRIVLVSKITLVAVSYPHLYPCPCPCILDNYARQRAPKYSFLVEYLAF